MICVDILVNEFKERWDIYLGDFKYMVECLVYGKKWL